MSCRLKTKGIRFPRGILLLREIPPATLRKKRKNNMILAKEIYSVKPGIG